MDKMFNELSRAANEEARRAILLKHSRSYSHLLEQPAFPEPLRPSDPARVRSDYLLFTAKLSALGRDGMLLLRCVYTGEFGVEPHNEEVGFNMIGMVDHFELAVNEYEDGPPFWAEMPFRFLPYNVLEALDEVIIEHERSKS